MGNRKLLHTRTIACGLLAAGLLNLFAGCGSRAQQASLSGFAAVSIVNVSYDATREFYEEYNALFQTYWAKKTGQNVEVTQSHGGSGKQARSVLAGNEADVVTLALESDVDELQKAGLTADGWIHQLPSDSAPYTSTIVFLVRKGNPKNIKDWNDVVKSGRQVITPNPKSSGGAKWNFLAAWAYADRLYGGEESKDLAFMKALYRNVSVLDSGSRGAAATFVENGQGDVLLTWENEAFLAMREHPGAFEVVTPSVSILAQPSVAVVHTYAKKHGTEKVAKAYLQYLYSDEAQRLEAQNGYRPTNKKILQEFRRNFDLKVQLVTIADAFGGWSKADQKFFADGAVFDQIYEK